MTMRGDFFGEALRHRELAGRLQDAMVHLGPMRRAELKRAIERPPKAVGVRFERRLVKRILDAVGDEPGNLPLMEFVLADLWEARREDLLLHAAYDSAGELQGAIAKRAEEAYARLSPEQQEVTHRVVRRLVRLGESAEATKQRVHLGDVGEAAEGVVADLARERLLVTGFDEASQEQTLEIAHEVLLRHWIRLLGWEREDREMLLWKQRLAHYIRGWEAGDRNPVLLPVGRVLDEAEGWLSKRGDDIEQRERSFIALSQDRESGVAAGARRDSFRLEGREPGLEAIASRVRFDRRRESAYVASPRPERGTTGIHRGQPGASYTTISAPPQATAPQGSPARGGGRLGRVARVPVFSGSAGLQPRRPNGAAREH